MTVLPPDVDLALGLGGTIDTDRAQLLIDKAVGLCETVVSPLPDTAGVDAVVLDIVAAAYMNFASAKSQTIGPYTVSGAPGGLYLTKQQRSVLRRAAGRGGAFSIDTMPAGTAEVQTVTILGSPTGGTFTLRCPWGITTAIPWNATGATVQAALAAIDNLAGTTVSDPVNGTYTVTLPVNVGPSTGQLVAESSLTGGTQPQVLTAVLTPGVYPPGKGLDSWEYAPTSVSASWGVA